MENTVLLATANAELRTLISSLAIKGVHVHEATLKSDLLAVPYCLAYVDAERLDDGMVDALSEMASDGDPGFRLIVLGTVPTIPDQLKAITEVAPYVWSKKIIAKQISAATALTRGQLKRERQFHERVHRIIRIYHDLREGKVVEIDRILGLYGMTERTLRRDLKVLRDLFPDLPIMYDRKFRS